jgi:hypothetical protein
VRTPTSAPHCWSRRWRACRPSEPDSVVEEVLAACNVPRLRDDIALLAVRLDG